jgi:hypothetical protein
LEDSLNSQQIHPQKRLRTDCQKQHSDIEKLKNIFLKTVRPTILIKRCSFPDKIAYFVASISSPLASAATEATPQA